MSLIFELLCVNQGLKTVVEMQDLHHRRFNLEGSLVFDCAFENFKL